MDVIWPPLQAFVLTQQSSRQRILSLDTASGCTGKIGLCYPQVQHSVEQLKVQGNPVKALPLRGAALANQGLAVVSFPYVVIFSLLSFPFLQDEKGCGDAQLSQELLN